MSLGDGHTKDKNAMEIKIKTVIISINNIHLQEHKIANDFLDVRHFKRRIADRSLNNDG
jgi:hypothetical protein